MPTVFISYRREDSAGYAGRLHEELEERLGHDQVFRDVDTLRAGQDFEDTIRQRVAQCAACIVMIGPQWLKAQTATGQRRLEQPGDYVVMEIAAALARPDLLTIPVLVGGAAMPPADELPEAIRPLARRHAFSARDETWDEDMDRLAAALPFDAQRPVPSSAGAAKGGWARILRRPLVVLALVLLALLAARHFRTGDQAQRPASDAVAQNPSAEVVAAESSPNAAAEAIDIPPRGAEIVHGDVVYTPLAGSVQRRGATTRVWLRVRASNDGAYGANLWDDSFRLVVGGSVVPASGGLNEILEGHSTRQAVVRFDVPSTPPQATLRISAQGQNGETPLDLSSNGRPAEHERQDPGDALSRATLTAVVENPQLLVQADTASVTLKRMTNRHFANAQRLRLDLQWKNDDRYALGTFDLVLRVDANGETIAPISAPSEPIDGGATYRGTIVFDIAPDAKQIVLKARLKGAERDVRFALR
jgi:hypothetical protein